MKPMLARRFGPRFNRLPAFVQPKLNGIRALCQFDNGTFTFQSRDELFWHPSKLVHLHPDLFSLLDVIGSRILDGELYFHNWSLQRINSAVAIKSIHPTEDTPQISYCIFDIVDPNQPFSTRFLDFKNVLDSYTLRHPHSRIYAVPTDQIFFVEQCDQFLNYYVSKGFEGAMYRPDGPYEFGITPHGTEKRSQFLWKHKHWEDGDFLCIGYTEGQGKASVGIGALICQTATGKTFNIGTGFDDRERIHLMQNPPIGKFIKTRYNFLSEDGIPCPAAQFLCVIE